jgi:hypothetical protein
MLLPGEHSPLSDDSQALADAFINDPEGGYPRYADCGLIAAVSSESRVLGGRPK